MNTFVPRPPPIVPGLDFTREEVREVLEKNRLLSLDLEFGLNCNFHCTYCYRYCTEYIDRYTRSVELPLNKIIAVLEEAIQLGVRKVAIIGGGEPLLPQYKDKLVSILEFLRERKIEVVVFTNGWFLKDYAKMFADLGVHVAVKLNSLRENIHDSMTRIRGSFKRALEAIRELKDYGYGIRDRMLAIEAVVTRINYDFIEELFRWCRENEIIPYIEKMTIQGRARINKELPLCRQE